MWLTFFVFYSLNDKFEHNVRQFGKVQIAKSIKNVSPKSFWCPCCVVMIKCTVQFLKRIWGWLILTWPSDRGQPTYCARRNQFVTTINVVICYGGLLSQVKHSLDALWQPLSHICASLARKWSTVVFKYSENEVIILMRCIYSVKCGAFDYGVIFGQS